MRGLIPVLLAAVPVVGLGDDFPTTETVRQVVRCMADIGGQNEENLYTCACRHGVIAAEMTYREYEEADLFQRYREMPGKRGALFRDSKNGDVLVEKLQALRKKAETECPLVKHIGPENAPPR